MSRLKDIKIDVHYYESVKPLTVSTLSELFHAAENNNDRMIEFIKISGTDTETGATHVIKFEFGSMQIIAPTEATSTEKTRQTRMTKLLGYILINAGLIDENQLQECLTCQQTLPSTRKLGEILVEKKYITPEQLENVISEQISGISKKQL